MKRKLVIFNLITLVIIFTCLYFYINNYDKVVINNESNSKNNIINTNALTMMYETSAGTGEYQVSSDTIWPQEGYIFNEELSSCENGSVLTWDDENKKVLLQANASDKCYVYFDKKLDIVYLADYIEGLYTNDGENGLYYHDGSGSYTNADQEAGDNSYRYAGANPNNYICFGSTAGTCPSDNLYRIIGVFGNHVKLIKNTSIGNNYWSGSSSNRSNIWSESTLNTVNLNQNYLNNIGNIWSSKIATTEWKVGGNTNQNIYQVPVKQTYQNEIVSPAEATKKKKKIGLMYVSDYGYATTTNNWNTNLVSYSSTIVRNNNWMWMGLSEWTITCYFSSMEYAFYVSSLGGVSDDDAVYIYYPSVRPSFYLESNVTYVSGSGSISDPIRIN